MIKSKIHYFPKLKSFIAFALVFLIGYQVNGQADSIKARESFLQFGAGIGSCAITDQSNSSLLYKGGGSSFPVSFVTYKKNRLFRVNFRYGSFSPTPVEIDNAQDFVLNTTQISMSTDMQWNVYTVADYDLKFYCGAALSDKIGMRENSTYLRNTNYTYNNVFSTAPIAGLEKDFLVNAIRRKNKEEKPFRPLRISFFVKIPVTSTIWRAPYIGLSENTFGENSMPIDPKSNYKASFNKYFNIETETSITYFLRNRNALKMSYYWDYHNFKNVDHPSEQLYKGLEISLIYRFTK